MKRRKLLAMMLALSLGISATPISVKAEMSSNDITVETLSAVTKKIKSKIQIPEALTEFKYEYIGVPGTEQFRYNLNWSEKEDGDRLRVQCDASANIQSFYFFQQNEKDHYTPKFKKNQLQEDADKFLKQVMPESIGNVRLTEGETGNIYSGRYIYTYERIHNGIPLPENTIQIEINYETGKVLSFQSNWDYGLSFPSGKVSVSEGEAKDKLKEKLNMNLAYYTAYVIAKNGQNKEKNFLAYTPNFTSLAIDAISGEVYTSKGEKTFGINSVAEAKMASADMVRDAGTGSSSLSEEEIKKIDEIADVISSKEAISIVKNNKDLLLDKDAEEVTAGLYQRKDSDGKPKEYQWEIYFNLTQDKGNQFDYGYYAHAVVNAKTGKILSYYADGSNNGQTKKVQPKYTKAEAEKRMEAFFALQVPEYFKQSAKSEEKADDIMLYDTLEDRGSQEILRYNRIYKNIPYNGNGIYGAMDMETGKICQFSYQWDEKAVFENPENRISEQAAEDAYLNVNQIPFMYEIDWKNNKPNVRLVYRTKVQPSYVSPFTGKQLNYDGTEYKPQESKFLYQDIGNSSSKESIEILADLGFGFSGGLFYPKKAITVKEWKILQGNIFDSYENSEVLKQWNVWNDENKIMTRLDAAKYCVIASGLNKAAVLPDTYQVTYKDKDKISKEDAGYVMLARGLNLVTGDSENMFHPNAQVTREEAAQMIFDMMNQH